LPGFPFYGKKSFHHNFRDPAKATGTEAEIMETVFAQFARRLKRIAKKFCSGKICNNYSPNPHIKILRRRFLPAPYKNQILLLA
jgi:hypothetical protein